MLKGKRRYVNVFKQKSKFEQKLFELGSAKHRVVGGAPRTGGGERFFIEKMRKQSKDII